MSQEKPVQVARVSWTAGFEARTDYASRSVLAGSQMEIWRTRNGALLLDEHVVKVERLVVVDLSDREALGRIVDDATRNAGPLTVPGLTYALREHRLRMEGAEQ